MHQFPLETPEVLAHSYTPFLQFVTDSSCAVLVVHASRAYIWGYVSELPFPTTSGTYVRLIITSKHEVFAAESP